MRWEMSANSIQRTLEKLREMTNQEALIDYVLHNEVEIYNKKSWKLNSYIITESKFIKFS